jgi:hypothetical protein
MGIRDHPTAPRSPWQNGHVERLIDSIRRESLDHLVVFDEALVGGVKADAPEQASDHCGINASREVICRRRCKLRGVTFLDARRATILDAPPQLTRHGGVCSQSRYTYDARQ